MNVAAQLMMFDLPPAPDLDKARAQRRANVRRNIEQGLIADVPASRTDHPETSHQAADFITATGTRAAHQRIVLDFVRRFPGCCYLEISAGTGIHKHGVMSRLCELAGNEKTPPFVYRGTEKVQVGKLKYTTWWPSERPENFNMGAKNAPSTQ